jgi:hypothetical protein
MPRNFTLTMKCMLFFTLILKVFDIFFNLKLNFLFHSLTLIYWIFDFIVYFNLISIELYRSYEMTSFAG